MASIYKRNGKGPYIVSWFDHNGRRREKSTRTTDKRAAQRIAAKVEADVALRRDGVIDSDLDSYAREGRRPISEHISDFRAHLIEKKSPAHAEQTIARIERIIDVSAVNTWDAVTPDVVERALAAIRAEDQLSDRTRNYYLTAFSMCMQHNVPIVVFNVKQPGHIADVVRGHPHGTRVTAERPEAPAPGP